jgi:Holliday junction resolvasome RuvABC endonuclease subunit
MTSSPHRGRIATLIGFDPGTVNCGVASMAIDTTNWQILKICARSYNGHKLDGEDWAGEMFGDRYRRLKMFQHLFVEIFDREQPALIGVEAPFFNPGQPTAYRALIEFVGILIEAIRTHSLLSALYRASPSEVKQAVKAQKLIGKEPVRAGLSKMDEVTRALDCPLDDLDEHAIDAIGVCMYLLTHLREGTIPNQW